jgi:hypothetical protein
MICLLSSNPSCYPHATTFINLIQIVTESFSSFLLFFMPPIRSSRISSSSSVPYAHFTRTSTASLASVQTSVSPLTLTKLTDYFISANDELYDLLNKDTELYCIVHAIEILADSHRTLNNLRFRQERYMLEQFDLALQNGLQGRLLPLDEHRQRTTSSDTTLSPRQTIN